MAEIIRNNPDTWPEVISANYGIVIDDHFWENNPLLSFGSGTAAPVTYEWVRVKSGGALDIHEAILKVAPRKGFVPPGHKCTRPGNPLESQLKYDPLTGEILEIYEQPTGRTDAVTMQHDVDYSVCEADRKMIKALDAIPGKERQ